MKRYYLAGAALGTFLVTPLAAVAQEVVGQLDEVVVTAQRKQESIQRAAVAVAVVGAAELTAVQGSSPAQLTRFVPALNVQSGGGSASTFFLRGVGNFGFNGYVDPAIAFNYDGVYLARMSSTSGLLYDLQRVEVLKGPQGTLYGRNATAGAINVLPVRPVQDEFGGYLSAGYGNYNNTSVQGALNIPLGERAAARLSANVARRDGYLSDGTSDERSEAVRGQFAFEITPNLTARLAADYSHLGGAGPGASYVGSFAFNTATQQYRLTPAPLGANIGLYDPRAQAYRTTIFAAFAGRNLAPLDVRPSLDNDFYGLNAELNLKTALGDLTVIPAYRRGALDTVFATTGIVADLAEKDRQDSLEVRFNGDRIGAFEYQVGGYYFDEKVKGNYTFAQQISNAFQEFTHTTKSYAVFSRVTAHLTDALRLVGGLRYTTDDKAFSGFGDLVQVVCQRRVNNVPSCPNAPLLPTVDYAEQLPFTIPAVGANPVAAGASGAIITRRVTRVTQPLKAERTTFRLAAEYDLAPRSLLYASFENGYRSGGFTLAPGHETYRPEFIDAYTVGSKNRLFDNRLELNAELFFWKYRDQQVTHAGLDSTGSQNQFTENIGRSVNKGVEVESQFSAGENTLLKANVQYLDATYKSYVYQVPLGNAPPYTSCAVSPNTANPLLRNVDCSGKPAYQAPKWTANLGVQQTVPVGAYKVVIKADTQYKSERFIGTDYLPHQRVGSTWTSNAEVALSPRDGPWVVGAYVHNLEDERIPVNGGVFSIGGLATIITSPPRTYGVTVSTTF